MKGRRVLITGGNGFLGGAFAAFLRKKAVPYVLYDRKDPEDIPSDITEVVHFAGLTPYSKTKKGTVHDDLYHAANVEETKKLLKVLEKHTAIKRLVHIGSAAEYGVGPKPFLETSREKPVNVYGQSKVAQTALIKEFAKKHRIKTQTLRIFNVMGFPKQSSPGLTGRPTLFEALFEQFGPAFTGEIKIGSKRDVRDLVALEDIMQAIFAALETKKGGRYEIINIGSGRGTTLGDMVKIFGSLVNKEYTITEGSKTFTCSIANVAKAKRLLGWEATTTLEEGVRALLGNKKRVLIVGAGVAGEMLVKEIKKENRTDILVLGFVDDDKKKQGKLISGFKVLGTVNDLPDIIEEKSIEQVLVSTPSIGKEMVNQVTSLLPVHVSIKVLPSVSSIILGKVDFSYVRDIDPSDLVGRPLIKTEQERISQKAKGKTFLVTGGAGSIGSEIVRQLYDSKAKCVIILDSWEEGIFNMLEALRAIKDADRPLLKAYIGNIRDRERVEEILKNHRVDVIVHAAAYKHVPLMEENSDEAYKTNYLGTKNVLDLAQKYDIADFVLVSTDKAVNPSSVMGSSKRKAELLVQEFAQKNPGKRFCAVRFGNVLNSSGSVLPIFLRQIRAHSAVTITHADMTRYFMSIPEAVSLVLLSWIIAKNGQILLLDMGEPIKILDFAINLIRIHGLEPYIDIPITITGIRPGEKIHEELTYDKNKLRKSIVPRIYIAEEIPTVSKVSKERMRVKEKSI
ncbi:hypothetical protein A2943_00025 [Candidatus Adlerbacteria bacterium RIFCSPLOWO2_01_FULL_51_16]|uniref:Polysaccharide biosynthesis protein CapD-like domain-containing protein n=1 Tax=Candidatus Adlerbacteria bacterium RIFCSPLOWO2_01_FULL_51_16 TaxID=1797243 RepID=A0A1F4XF00_9BACT|nr:MAG: hypothetical protein A2943_00025 [Candidatus Adlerbacteria bacterium RIFCSPLOWO2_01_FULL_51_16]